MNCFKTLLLRIIFLLFVMVLHVSVVSAETIKLNKYHCKITIEDKSEVSFSPNDSSYLRISGSDSTWVFVKCMVMGQTAENIVNETTSVFRLDYLEIVDSLFFEMSGLEPLSKEWRFLTCKLEKEYDYQGKKYYTVCMYAREHAYLFCSNDKDLLEDVLSNFYSSLRFGFKNYLSFYVQQFEKLFDYPQWLNYIMMFVSVMINFAWCVFIFLFCLYNCPSDNYVWFFIKTIVLLNIFLYLCLHDYYMDWIMGFGSFWNLLVNFFSMFADD